MMRIFPHFIFQDFVQGKDEEHGLKSKVKGGIFRGGDLLEKGNFCRGLFRRVANLRGNVAGMGS